MIEIHYFASIRESLGMDKERLALPETVSTVEQLVDHLGQLKGDSWRNNLDSASTLVAINQTVASHSSSVNDGDEVAFFPPVTGG